MNRFGIKTTCMTGVIVLGAASLTGCGGLKQLDGESTLVTVNGTEIPAGVVSLAVRSEQAQQEYYNSYMSQMFGSEYTTAGWDKDASEGKGTAGSQLRDKALTDVEEMALIRERAEEYDITITDEEQQAIDEAAASFVEANDADMLKKIGVSEDSVKEYLELYTYHNKALEPVVADEKIEITDEEAAQTSVNYAFLSADGLEDDARQQVKDVMQTYLDRIKAMENPTEEDMKSLAEELSSEDQTISASTYTYGADDEDDNIDAAVKEAAAKLADGEICDEVVEAENGFYVIRMNHVKDEEATQTKKASLLKEKQQEKFEEIVDGWRDEADIAVNKSVWKLIKVTDKVSFMMAIPQTDVPEDTDSEEETTEEDAASEEESAEEESAN